MSDVLNYVCSQQACPLKTTGECLESHTNLSECPYAKSISDQFQATNGDGKSVPFSGTDFEVLPFNGDEMYDHELLKLTARYPTTLNLLMGDSEGGKTTLISALYDLFQKQPVSGFNFAGSRTQIGFEKRCFLARWNSYGKPAPTTEHTAAMNMHYLHLAIRDTKCKFPIQHILYTDVSGEQYTIIRDHDSEMRKFTIINRADNIFYIANGSHLLDNSKKHIVKSNTKKLLERAVDCGQINQNTRINFIVTNLDKIYGSENQVETYFINDIKASFKDYIGEFYFVASRTENKKLPAGFGLDKFLVKSIEKKKQYSKNIFDNGSAKREFQRFQY